MPPVGRDGAGRGWTGRGRTEGPASPRRLSLPGGARSRYQCPVTMSGVRSSMPRASPGVRCPVPCSRCLVTVPGADSRFQVPGSRFSVPDPGSRCLVPGAGSRLSVPGSRCRFSALRARFPVPIPGSQCPVADSRLSVPGSRFPVPVTAGRGLPPAAAAKSRAGQGAMWAGSGGVSLGWIQPMATRGLLRSSQ